MILGIDLGTTNSLIAYYREGTSFVIENELGHLLTPSVISFREEGQVIVGDAAYEMRITNPNRTFTAFKRDMGTSQEYSVDGSTFDPVTLSSLVLKKLTMSANNALEQEIKDVVVSVPAYFNDLQRKDTIKACEMIDLKVVGLISEPTAAALAYHLHENKDEQVIAVVDMGGGTFDVSILDIFDSVIEVEAVSGDNYLGGEDFDQAIFHAIIKKYDLLESPLSKKDISKLLFTAQEIKKAFDQSSMVTKEIILDSQTLEIHLNAVEFEQICEPVLNRIREPIKKAVRDAGFSLTDIDDVILVGGSTKMPLVKKEISRLFGRLPLSHLNPDLVVVKGAAVYGEMRQKNQDLKEMVLTDVCPYTLGSSVTKNLVGHLKEVHFDPIIERNMTVPISREKIYYPYYEYQKAINIDVYQGEHRDVKKNIHLGNIEIDFKEMTNQTDGAVKVRFTYDINGILEVQVTWIATGEVKKAILLNNNNLSDDEVKKRMASLASLKIHPIDREENLYVLSKAERLYELSLGSNREMITEEINRFKAVVHSQDDELIKRGTKRMYEVFDLFKEF